jgi:hypothetical protein
VDKQRTPPHLTRPDDQQNFTETTLNGAVAQYATQIIVTSATGFADYLTIGIETDELVLDASDYSADGDTQLLTDGRIVHWTFVDDSYTSGTTIPLAESMPYAAASGLKVFLHHDGRFLGTNEVTINDL